MPPVRDPADAEEPATPQHSSDRPDASRSDAEGDKAPPLPTSLKPARRRGVIPRDLLDEHAVYVVERLQQAGYEAYLVGGCVRDLLCGLEPKDFDIATDAHPNRIKRLFRNARVIGRRFRLVHVRFPNNHVLEVSTFRADPTKHETPTPRNEEGRRDWRDSVENIFGTAPEDAHRRDFTINALYYDPVADEVLDWVGGMDDIERKVVESIGEPTERILEDPVRMLRAVHFAKRLGFTLEASLEQAIRAQAACLTDASQARLYVELVKLLSRRRARPTIDSLRELGVLQTWLPELCAAFDDPMPGEDDVTVGEETLAILGAADTWGLASHQAPESLALSALFGPWLLSTASATRHRSYSALAEHYDAVFRPVALRMSIPRWAAGEMREALLAQDALRNPPPQPRRAQGVLRRRSFPVALRWFAFQLKAAGEGPEQLDEWIERADDANVRHEIAPPAQRVHDRVRKGAARRGGRGRSRGGSRSSRGSSHRAGRSERSSAPRDVTPEADAWMPPPDDA